MAAKRQQMPKKISATPGLRATRRATPVAMPTATPRKPLTSQQRQDKALQDLMKERKAYEKKYGYYPSDVQLMRERKKRMK